MNNFAFGTNKRKSFTGKHQTATTGSNNNAQSVNSSNTNANGIGTNNSDGRNSISSSLSNNSRHSLGANNINGTATTSNSVNSDYAGETVQQSARQVSYDDYDDIYSAVDSTLLAAIAPANDNNVADFRNLCVTKGPADEHDGEVQASVYEGVGDQDNEYEVIVILL